ncbi:MAG: helix-turn-helix domain-containing protein [Betaproteobacteria bacterium]|nr:helix-turn-helix domain-containing protein [Betaproteobacteria bacterium]
MSQLLSTDAVAAGERLALWTDLICDVYVQLDCEPVGERQAFNGSIRRDTLATLDVSQVTSTPQHVRRTSRQIAKATEDSFLVSIQSAGLGVVRQDGREAMLRPGDFALYDSTRPYELLFEGDFQQFVLMLPGETLRSQLRDTERMTATAVSGQRGAGHLMIGMMETLWRDIDVLEPASAGAVSDSVLHILVAGLKTMPAAQKSPVSNLTALHRHQVGAFVRQHLRDPRLSVAMTAAALGISVSTAHRAFQGEPCSLAHWIWAERLDAIKRDLADASLRRRGVSDIAFGWGFNDAAHFSRAFKERFGVTPRQFRQALYP